MLVLPAGSEAKMRLDERLERLELVLGDQVCSRKATPSGGVGIIS